MSVVYNRHEKHRVVNEKWGEGNPQSLKTVWENRHGIRSLGLQMYQFYTVLDSTRASLSVTQDQQQQQQDNTPPSYYRIPSLYI